MSAITITALIKILLLVLILTLILPLVLAIIAILIKILGYLLIGIIDLALWVGDFIYEKIDDMRRNRRLRKVDFQQNFPK